MKDLTDHRIPTVAKLEHLLLLPTVLACACLLQTQSVQAADSEITYDLSYAPGAPGHGVYEYTVFNNSISPTLDDFAVFFPDVVDPDAQNYHNLAVGPSWPAGWDSLIIQPSAIDLGGYGEGFRATAGTGIGLGSSQGGFSVSFDYSGSGTPARQYYEIYNVDTMDMIGSGYTTPASHGVPDAGATALYLSLALASLAGFRAYVARKAEKNGV
jgi:hypothetical protein